MRPQPEPEPSGEEGQPPVDEEQVPPHEPVSSLRLSPVAVQPVAPHDRTGAFGLVGRW